MCAMIREKRMPLFIQKKIRDSVDYNTEGANTEMAVLLKASELGYEMEEENVYHHHGSEEGGWMHNVKLVDGEGHVGWLHFNHPAPAYAKRNGEWYWYIM